jgi:5-methylcytosine-specific restriction endonuclease McrA
MLGELLELLFSPLVWLIRKGGLFQRRRAGQDEIKLFYKSADWKRARFDQLRRKPACRYCGHSAKDGAKMNVDHIKPLSKRWDLRLDRRNLQTACASCNWGKGGR